MVWHVLSNYYKVKLTRMSEQSEVDLDHQTAPLLNAMHEVQLFSEEMRFINTLMPKAFCLMKTAGQTRLGKSGLKVGCIDRSGA
jgi:hypothetical protein